MLLHLFGFHANIDSELLQPSFESTGIIILFKGLCCPVERLFQSLGHLRQFFEPLLRCIRLSLLQQMNDFGNHSPSLLVVSITLPASIKPLMRKVLLLYRRCLRIPLLLLLLLPHILRVLLCWWRLQGCSDLLSPRLRCLRCLHSKAFTVRSVRDGNRWNGSVYNPFDCNRIRKKPRVVSFVFDQRRTHWPKENETRRGCSPHLRRKPTRESGGTNKQRAPPRGLVCCLFFHASKRTTLVRRPSRTTRSDGRVSASRPCTLSRSVREAPWRAR